MTLPTRVSCSQNCRTGKRGSFALCNYEGNSITTEPTSNETFVPKKKTTNRSTKMPIRGTSTLNLAFTGGLRGKHVSNHRMPTKNNCAFSIPTSLPNHVTIILKESPPWTPGEGREKEPEGCPTHQHRRGRRHHQQPCWRRRSRRRRSGPS